MKIGKYEFAIMDLLLVFVPISLLLSYSGLGDSTTLFTVSLLAILPLASKMGHATEELAKIYGGQLGSLLNVTFGNAAELIIALIAINKGLEELVKASIAGSIIGNLLFVLGLSMFVGGLKNKEQKFSTNLAGLNSTMLLIAFMSIMIPSLFHFVPVEHRGNDEQTLSTVVSILLIGTYVLSMVFSLKTHQHLFRESEEERKEKPHWSRNFSITVLALSTIALALVSEVFVGHIEAVGHQFGLTELFIGAVIVALVGNAAEHISSVSFALKNNIDLSINVTVGSSLQIAMFVVPICVLVASLINKTMDLVFTPFEIIAVFASILIVNEISSDGRCNWFEGAQLMIMYLIIATLFFFVR
ncbi:calcium/proton exchanger [Candidatus Micrarchaeota archaeon]|nr:calcium/proton exchanger [Candidatus Micrarchaeota archaeon]